MISERLVNVNERTNDIDIYSLYMSVLINMSVSNKQLHFKKNQTGSFLFVIYDY